MNDMLLMERLEQTLEAPPPEPLPLPDKGASIGDIERQAAFVIRAGEGWLNRVKSGVAKARKHQEHRTRCGEMWAHMEPVLTRSIEKRRQRIESNDAWLAQVRQIDHDDARALEAICNRIGTHLVQQHNELVRLYYLLKADADNASDDTKSDGDEISSAEELEAFFNSFRAA